MTGSPYRSVVADLRIFPSSPSAVGLITGVTLKQAEPRLKQILQAIATSVYEFEHDGRPERLSYTLSAGAAENAPSDTSETIIKRADEGLYDAKHRGKNCVVCRKHTILSRFLGS